MSNGSGTVAAANVTGVSVDLCRRSGGQHHPSTMTDNFARANGSLAGHGPTCPSRWPGHRQ